MATIRSQLIRAGVRNLKEFGYPGVNAENILTDRIYSEFFDRMLAEHGSKEAGELRVEIAANREPESNPPAFPGGGIQAAASAGSDSPPTQSGMSLRDYFANSAMKAVLCGLMTRGDGPSSRAELVSLAARSYELADVMLAARKESR